MGLLHVHKFILRGVLTNAEISNVHETVLSSVLNVREIEARQVTASLTDPVHLPATDYSVVQCIHYMENITLTEAQFILVRLFIVEMCSETYPLLGTDQGKQMYSNDLDKSI